MGAFEGGHDDDDALPAEGREVEAALNLLDERIGGA